MHAHYCSLPPYLYASIPSAPWAQNFSEFTMHGSSVRLRASVGKHIRSITKDLRGHAFPFEPTCFEHRKHWCFKKHE